MEDYQGNSQKAKQEPEKEPPAKNVEKVVVGEVVVQKKSIGRKFKDIFIEADIRSVTHYVASEVLLPALRNMIVDSTSKGVERMMYGEAVRPRSRYGGGSRTTYNSPVSRPYRDSPLRRPGPDPRDLPRSRSRGHEDFILSSRDEADLVLERMNDIIDTYEVASLADLKDLVGFATTHVDNKWGWIYLGDVQIRQVREGYLLDLPPAEPITNL